MYCGIDIGTSSLKCMFISEDLKKLGFGKATVGLYHGQYPFEADPIEWLKALAQAIEMATQNMRNRTDISIKSLRAVAISGNGPTLVPVGKNGLPLGRAISWIDRSPIEEAEIVSKATGKHIDPSFYLPKVIRCLKTNPSEIHSFFSGPEYLAYLIGAEAVSYLVDDFYDSYIWDKEACKILQIKPELFPKYEKPAKVIGKISKQASEAIGLPEGTPIVSSFPDFLASLVGSGTVEPGLACDRSGSSEALNLCSNTPFPTKNIFSLPHAIEGYWNLSGGISTSGKSLDWFTDIAKYGIVDADSIFEDAAESETLNNNCMFFPYLNGERAPFWNPAMKASFANIGLGTSRSDMARAVIESIGFGLRIVNEILLNRGYKIEKVRVSGAAGKNNILNQIKADILGLELEIPESIQCETIGDACACAVAIGDAKNLKEVASRINSSKVFTPNSKLQQFYNEKYQNWKEILLRTNSISSFD